LYAIVVAVAVAVAVVVVTTTNQSDFWCCRRRCLLLCFRHDLHDSSFALCAKGEYMGKAGSMTTCATWPAFLALLSRSLFPSHSFFYFGFGFILTLAFLLFLLFVFIFFACAFN